MQLDPLNPAGGPADLIAPSDWRQTFDRLALGALTLVALFLAGVPLLKEWRWRRRYHVARDRDAVVVAAFEHFAEEASELASAPRFPAESARSYARRLAVGSDSANRHALALAQLYEVARYSRTGVTSDDEAEARRLDRRLRAHLWSQATWWERAARLFAPKGLAEVTQLREARRRKAA